MTLDPDAPFVVRNDPKRFQLQVVGGIVLAVGAAALTAAVGFSPVVLLALVCGVAIAVLSIVSLRTSRPVMSADTAGVDLQAFRGPDGVRHLAWEQIDAIYVHRISRNFRMLCVRPADLEAERAWAGAQRTRQIDKSVKITGAPYSANLVAAGYSDERALEQLRTLAAGRTRTPVGER